MIAAHTGALIANEADLLIKGCSRSWVAVGRLHVSRCKHFNTKSLQLLERRSGTGGSSLLFTILNMAATFKKNM